MTIATRNGARALVDALVERGVRDLFGVPGHGAYPIYGALTEVPELRPFVGRNEQGAGFIADAWSWSTNKVAVATSVPQCGLTNSATALLQATQDGERLLFLFEEDPLHRDVLRSVARYYERAGSAEEIRPALNRLMDALEVGRPAGAALEIPSSVLTSPAEKIGPRPERPAPLLPDDRLLDQAADLLSKADRPMIVAGRGIVAAGAEANLRALAESLRAPVLADRNAKGVLPEDHPLALGYTWSPTSPAEAMLKAADVVLAIGPRENAATGTRSAEQLASQLIHLDWDDDEQVKGEPARVKLAGHVGETLAQLAQRVRPRQSASVAAEHIDELLDAPWRYAETRIPWGVGFFRELQAALPRDVLFFTDSMVGLWIFRLLRAYEGRSFRFGWGNGTGTLGYGLPGAIGAKYAAPDREVVAIAGDGAFLYNPQELATAALYGLKITVIVCNDNCFGAVRDNTAEQFGKAIGHELKNPDFMRLAEAFGMRAVKVDSPEGVGPALREALAQDRSTLIEVPLELRPARY